MPSWVCPAATVLAPWLSRSKALWSVLTESSSLSVQNTMIHIAAAAVISIVIYLSCWYTHGGATYSKKFNTSLTMLTVLSAAAVSVIGNNIALALGLVGMLSIIRCRIPVQDVRDTAYTFWAVIAGVCCGAGEYVVAGVGSAVVFLLMLGRGKSEERIHLIVRGTRSKCLEIEGLIFDFFGGKAILQTKRTTAETVELTFEMPRSIYRVTYQRSHDITDKLYALGGVECVNIVPLNDRISE